MENTGRIRAGGADMSQVDIHSHHGGVFGAGLTRFQADGSLSGSSSACCCSTFAPEEGSKPGDGTENLIYPCEATNFSISPVFSYFLRPWDRFLRAAVQLGIFLNAEEKLAHFFLELH